MDNSEKIIGDIADLKTSISKMTEVLGELKDEIKPKLDSVNNEIAKIPKTNLESKIDQLKKLLGSIPTNNGLNEIKSTLAPYLLSSELVKTIEATVKQGEVLTFLECNEPFVARVYIEAQGEDGYKASQWAGYEVECFPHFSDGLQTKTTRISGDYTNDKGIAHLNPTQVVNQGHLFKSDLRVKVTITYLFRGYQ